MQPEVKIYFTMEVPDYKVQPRDILYISVKAQTPEGSARRDA